MSGRVRSTVVVAVLAAALVSGCAGGAGGGGGASPAAPPPPPDQVVRDSYAKLVSAGSAHLGVEGTTEAEGRKVVVPGDGELDLARRAYALTLTVPGLGPLRGVGTNGVLYLQSDQLTSQIPGSKQWLLLDPVKLRAAGPTGQQLSETTDNPFGQLALVQGAGPDTRAVGPDTVGGEPATHYTTTIDFARARQGTTDPSISGALDDYARKVGSPTVPGEAWTDGQGRLRRLLLSIPPGPARPPVTATLTFTALGAPVPTVVAPPADQVTDLAEAISRGGG